MTQRFARLVTLAAAMTAMAASGAASAQGRDAAGVHQGGWSLGGGIGLTASPTTFLMQIDGLYQMTPSFSVGPQFQFGVASGETVISGLANARYDFDLSQVEDSFISKITPFVNAGLGFTYEDVTFIGSGTGFLIAFGGGLRYPLNDRLSLESSTQFNVVTTGAGPFNSDKFYWSLQMIGARFHF